MRRGTDASGPGSNGLSNSARKAIESVYERPIDSSPQPLPAGQSAASLNVPSNAAVSLNASMDEPDPDLIVPLRRGQAGAGAGAIGEEEGDEHGADEPLWLHFTPSKKVIQQRLAEQGLGDGLFLVRTSRRFSGEYMLALCHGGQAHNYRIRFAEGQFSLDKTRFFSTLPELVDFYRMDPDRVLPVPLLRACPRPDAESSVAYIPSASTPRTRLSATLTDFDLNAHAHA